MFNSIIKSILIVLYGTHMNKLQLMTDRGVFPFRQASRLPSSSTPQTHARQMKPERKNYEKGYPATTQPMRKMRKRLYDTT
jgi:hypothetical protein